MTFDNVPCLEPTETAGNASDGLDFMPNLLQPNPFEMTLTPPWPKSESTESTFNIMGSGEQSFEIYAVQSIIGLPSPYASNCMQDWSMIPYRPLPTLYLGTNETNKTGFDAENDEAPYSQIVSLWKSLGRFNQDIRS